MVAFLCLFFPSVIAVAIIARIKKENLGLFQYLAYYAVFAVIINGIMFWILSFMFDKHSISAPDVFTTSFSAKYILLSSILAVVSANILGNLLKNKSLSKDKIQKEEPQEKIDENIKSN